MLFIWLTCALIVLPFLVYWTYQDGELRWATLFSGIMLLIFSPVVLLIWIGVYLLSREPKYKNSGVMFKWR